MICKVQSTIWGNECNNGQDLRVGNFRVLELLMWSVLLSSMLSENQVPSDVSRKTGACRITSNLLKLWPESSFRK